MVLNFKNIFKSKKKNFNIEDLYALLNDDVALTSNFGEDIYMSDFVNNAIDRIATEISKISVVSEIEKNGIIKKQNDDLTRLFKFRPNPLQTTKDFLSCCEWLRRKDYNCFIYPQYQLVTGRDGITYKKYVALYPLNPTYVEFGTDDSGIWLIRFTFSDGSQYVLDYSEIIHLRWRRGKNNVVGGGDDNGQANTTDVLNSIKVLDKVTQGLPKALETSLKIKGVFHSKSLIDKEKLSKTRDDFESHIFNSKAGIVATDLAGEFTPVNINPTTLDSEVMKYLTNIIRERYGISSAILSGDYNGEQHSAFYQSCIEDFIVEFTQATSSVLFTQREQDIGHIIKCYYSKVAYMNNTDKIQLATIATNTALMSKDEIRDMFGLEVIGGTEGARKVQSLNFVEENIASTYQVGDNRLKKEGEKDEQGNEE